MCLSTLIWCPWGICIQPQTVISTLLGSSDFGVLGHLCLLSQNDSIIASWLRLIATSNCFLYPYKIYIKCLRTLICCPWTYRKQPQTVISTLLGSNFEVLGHLGGQNDVITSCLRLTATSNWFPHPNYIWKSVWAHLYAVHGAYGISLKQLYQHYLAQILGYWITFVSQNDIILAWLRLTASSNLFLHPH